MEVVYGIWFTTFVNFKMDEAWKSIVQRWGPFGWVSAAMEAMTIHWPSLSNEPIMFSNICHLWSKWLGIHPASTPTDIFSLDAAAWHPFGILLVPYASLCRRIERGAMRHLTGFFNSVHLNSQFTSDSLTPTGPHPNGDHIRATRPIEHLKQSQLAPQRDPWVVLHV